MEIKKVGLSTFDNNYRILNISKKVVKTTRGYWFKGEKV